MRTSCCGCILGLAILIFGQIGSGQNTITYTYDVSTPTSPQLHSTHTEQGRVISSTYDSTNHQVDQTSIDSLGHTTTYSYDPNTNTASAGSTISTSGTGISTVYDSANNQLDVTSVDSLGNTTTYAYDATSRVIQSSESISSPGTATSSAYDSQHHQINVTTGDSLGACNYLRLRREQPDGAVFRDYRRARHTIGDLEQMSYYISVSDNLWVRISRIGVVGNQYLLSRPHILSEKLPDGFPEMIKVGPSPFFDEGAPKLRFKATGNFSFYGWVPRRLVGVPLDYAPSPIDYSDAGKTRPTAFGNE